MRDLGLRGAEIVKLCLEDIDWHAGTLVVRDERLGANIKLQLDIVSFFDIDFERPAEALADQCAGCASRLDRGVEILIHNRVTIVRSSSMSNRKATRLRMLLNRITQNFNDVTHSD